MSVSREYYDQNWVSIPFEYEGSKEAFALFHQLPTEHLPYLEPGYQWLRQKNHYYLHKHDTAPNATLTIVFYEPEIKPIQTISYVALINDVHTQVYGTTRSKENTFKGARAYPFAIKPSKHIGKLSSSTTGYQVIGYKYPDTKSKNKQNHCPGHALDHADSGFVGDLCSSYDPRNYIPEPPGKGNWWGLAGRRKLVDAIRRREEPNGTYMQWAQYGANPELTRSGAPVPESVIFTDLATQQSYNPLWETARPIGKDAKTAIDKMLDNCAIHTNLIPFTSVYDRKADDAELQKIADSAFNIGKNVNKWNSQRTTQDALRLHAKGADFELDSIDNTLETVLLFSAHNEAKKASTHLQRALSWGENQILNDEYGIYIDPKKRAEIDKCLSANTILDPDEELSDMLRQVCSDQRKKTTLR